MLAARKRCASHLASVARRRSCSLHPLCSAQHINKCHGSANGAGVKKQINCPARCGSAPAVGSCHRPPSLIGVYEGHMASEGAAVPARPAPTRKTALPPVGRRWMRCAAAPAAVPVGSGRGRTRRRPRSSRHSTMDPPGRRPAAPPALPLLDRGPGGSREVGHLWEGRSGWKLGQHTHRNYGDEKKPNTQLVL